MLSSGLSCRGNGRGNGRLERGKVRRRRMRMANDESADANRDECPCGSAFCCSGKLLDFQQYVERLYWSNPLPEPLELMELVPRRLAGFEPDRSLLGDVLDAVCDEGDGNDKGNKPDDEVEEASGGNIEEDSVEEEGGYHSYQGDVQKEAEKVDDQEGKEKEAANINLDAGEKNDELGDSRDPSLSGEPMDLLETVCSSSSPPPLLEEITNDSNSILKISEDENLRKDDDGLRTGPPDLQRESSSSGNNYYVDSSMRDNSFYNSDDMGSQPPSPMYMGDVANSARFSGELPSLSPIIHGIAVEVKQEIMTDDEEGSEYISGGGVDGDEGRIEEEDRTSPPELEISCFSAGPSMPTLDVEAPVIIWESSPSTGRPSRTRSMQYQCSTPFCGKRFSRLEAMVTHEKEHTLGDPRPFHCKNCNRSYASKSSFEGHLSRHRFCKKCGHQMKNASNKKGASLALEEFCDSCRCKFSEAVLLKHLKKNEDSSDSDGNRDADASKSEPPFKKMRRGTDSPIKDSEDNISTEVKGDGQDDAATDVSEEEKEEGEPGEGTTSEIEEVGHSLGTNFQCTDCGKVYQKQKWYKMHMLQHQKTEWPCKLCDEILDSKNALRKHKKKNHPSNRN